MEINPVLLFFGIVMPIVSALLFLLIQNSQASRRSRYALIISGTVMTVVLYLTLPKFYSDMLSSSTPRAADAFTLVISAVVCLATVAPMNLLKDKPPAQPSKQTRGRHSGSKTKLPLIF